MARKDKNTGLIHQPVVTEVHDTPPNPDLKRELRTGDWYWYQEEGEEKWLGCIVELGSNYAKVEGVRHEVRVHYDSFHEYCKYEPNASAIISGNIDRYQKEANLLMGKVKELTARLAVTNAGELSVASETHALVVQSNNQSMKNYKKDLVKAQTKTLPDLFKEIKSANESMGRWMQAELIPLEAQAKALEGSIGLIKDRVFNVELYAGLVETVKQIADGEPAAPEEKIRLFQRRFYMDEECLAEYETGGMDFKSIKAFDKWLTKPQHLARILPFPRCIVAFRVRRNKKNGERATNLIDFINMMFEDEANKKTFLYMRNGERVYRLSTEIEFDEKLFPDMDRTILMQTNLWAKMFAGRVDKLMTDAEHQGFVEEHLKHLEEQAKIPEKDQWRSSCHCDFHQYVKFTPDTVYYDDMNKRVGREMAKHNRLVLVLQGLLDRSPVFHPHPPWSLWTQDGFEASMQLIYDDTRALADGEKPDFEAYRAKLNASLKTGSVTVGQDEAWERHEAVKENARRGREWRGQRSRFDHLEFYQPYGNPGPGSVARVKRFSKRKGTCIYVWERDRLRRHWKSDSETVAASFECSPDNVLNVDAYKTGDFKIFFNDPRTRADYLQWAPLLLEAEEYLAGNRPLGDAAKRKHGRVKVVTDESDNEDDDD